MKEGWEMKKLGEVMLVKRGGSPRPIKKYLTDSPDGLNWIKISDATKSGKYIYETAQKIKKEGLYKTRFVEKGDFLLSNSMSFGRPYIMGTTGCIHDGWLVLKELNKGTLNKDFLYYLLASPYLFKQFDTLAAGSTVRNLNTKLVNSVTIPIPPLPEQKKIVTLLDTAFAKIDQVQANIEKNIANAQELFQSKLNEVFSQRGEGWEEKTLGEVCSLITDGKHGNCKDLENSGFYFLSAKNVRNETLEFKKGRQITKKDFEETHRRTDLKPGDICMINTGATIGRMAIAPNDERTYKTTFQKSVAVIKPIPNLLDNIYCSYLLKADLKKLTKASSGTAVKNLLLGDLKKHIVNLPLSIDEQKNIAKDLKIFDFKIKSLESFYSKKLLTLAELKKSLLQKAFSGELT